MLISYYTQCRNPNDKIMQLLLIHNQKETKQTNNDKYHNISSKVINNNNFENIITTMTVTVRVLL